MFQTQFLVGDSLSVVDLAAWSVLQSLSGVDLSQNMSKWQQRITAALGVGECSSLVTETNRNVLSKESNSGCPVKCL